MLKSIQKKLKSAPSRARFLIQKKWSNLQDLFLINRFISQHCIELKPTQKTALIIAPHQDDETLGCGGLIALKCAQSVQVGVAFLTDGSGSHPNYPNLKSIRQQEALNALTSLGVEASKIHFLEQPDGQLAHLSETNYDSLLKRFSEILEQFHPQEIYVTYQKDGHPDHETSAKLVKDTVDSMGLETEIFQYPIWSLWTLSLLSSYTDDTDKKLIAYRMPIRSTLSQKKQAMTAYQSQCSPLPGYKGMPLPPEFLNRFYTSYEIFLKEG
jgi:N-acetylglucosamine malate deacetylase 1